MSRNLKTLRASIQLGAFLVACGAMHSAQAADATVQRVAMACTQGSEMAGCRLEPMRAGQAVVAQRVEKSAVRAPARQSTKSHTAAVDSDGSRFAYDSCGCSN